ncbi:probable cytochrome P450 313a4 [Teleopsis dalmanni]|uniref:probable cytochrome P450 313a4 n=1 Tax=Teleopsis dalmanni TaxID=139649 RepID=UPI0018CDE41E|nr:probable cytochrome P450 313a4 [Teleopsis dalmanni]
MESLKAYEVLISVFVVLPVILLLYWLWTRRNIYKCDLSFIGYPIIGSLYKLRNVNSIISAVGHTLRYCKNGTACFWAGFFPVILTADPDIVSNVLRSQEFLNKAETIYYYMGVSLKGGLFTTPATEWVHNRRMINPCFSNNVLVSLFPIFNKAKNDLIERCDALVDNKNHNILNLLQTLTLSMTVETTMGKVMHKGKQESQDLISVFSFLMKYITVQALMSFFKLGFIFEFYSKLQQKRVEVWMFVDKLIQAKLNKCSNTDNNNNNTESRVLNTKNIDAVPSIRKEPKIFIDQAIKLYENQQFTWNDLISESVTIVAASFETTANAVYSTLVMLAMHPDIQQRLFEEILDVFPEKDFYIECDQLSQLSYLELVINETLRLAPSVPIIGRQAMKDTQIGVNLLPKGIQVFISIYHLHRRTDIWGPNADKFEPERFSVENYGEKQKNAYIPFSKGPRNCIGRRYAMFSMKVLLCGLLRNYKFKTDFKFEDLRCTHRVSLRYIVEPELRLCRRT